MSEITSRSSENHIKELGDLVRIWARIWSKIAGSGMARIGLSSLRIALSAILQAVLSYCRPGAPNVGGDTSCQTPKMSNQAPESHSNFSQKSEQSRRSPQFAPKGTTYQIYFCGGSMFPGKPSGRVPPSREPHMCPPPTGGGCPDWKRLAFVAGFSSVDFRSTSGTEIATCPRSAAIFFSDPRASSNQIDRFDAREALSVEIPAVFRRWRA